MNVTETARKYCGHSPGIYLELLIPCGVSGYALVYEIRGDTVVILALKHQREAGYLD